MEIYVVRPGDSVDRIAQEFSVPAESKKQGGIYMANNEVMPNFRWQPHEALARLRKLNKAFYRKVKKAAVNSPREWFNFNNMTK